MKHVLFDEDVPRPLRRHLAGFEIQTAVEAGWAGVKNGELRLGVVVLATGSVKLHDLVVRAADIQAALNAVEPGQILWIRP